MKRWFVRWKRPAQRPGDQTEFAMTVESKDAAQRAVDYINSEDGWALLEFTEKD